MDFDRSKENIQPLRGGRNVSQLGVALQAQINPDFQRELLQQKDEFENAIKNYTGSDPLENWYHYISWVEQSYPKNGHEGNLVPLLEHCLSKFENDKQYTNDRRFCKLWIKYIDLQQNPLELYHMMHARGLCRGCADLYKAWAYYHEASGDFQNANHVFECGKRELAQPYDDLMVAHNNLFMAAGQHMIHGPDENGLQEKRQALTSLHTYKPGRVASVRQATSSSGSAGILPVAGSVIPKTNAPISVYEDRGDEIRGDEAAPISILTVAKRQEMPKENTLKPGPWTTVPVKKRLAVQRSTPGFTVHEDGVDDGQTGLKLPSKFPQYSNENYNDWIVNLIIPEPKDDKLIPMYPKAKVYSAITTEYSLEELRALKYFNIKEMLGVASNETNQAVQSISGMSMSTVEQSTSEAKLFDHHSIYKDEKSVVGNFPSQPSYSKTCRQSSFSQHQPTNIWNQELPPQIFAPPSNVQRQSNVDPLLASYDIWNNSNSDDISDVPARVVAKPKVASKFSIYEQSNLSLQEQIEPKGSAMKTPFKDLNADELAETGSRGGMDIAAAAPVDSAKRLPVFDDDSSSSSFDKIRDNDLGTHDISCNTQMFNFNLNAMQVSTPQNKQQFELNDADEDNAKNTRKQLFSEQKPSDPAEKALSIILEETKSCYGSSSSSSGTTTKSSLFSNHTKPNHMATISEEHNSYLAQNMMANAALRRSLLGDLMDFETQQSSSPTASVLADVSINRQVKTIPQTTTTRTTTTTTTNVAPLNYVPSDPFTPSLLNDLLQRVGFPGPHTRGYYILTSIPRLAVRKDSISIGPDKYLIEKQLGKGNFGVVFRGTDLKTGKTVALKTQKESNKWEFYICRELQVRLVDHPLRDRFMDVKIGYFSEQASIFISEFMPCGSLLDVANAVKQKSGRSMKESLCIYFCLEMLKVVQAMHEVKIIHADIKPDNFLVQLAPDSTVGLQLIDFGCSIDMSLFPSDTCFTRQVTTENFVCCEMLDGRPWNYHTDMFCVAATAHVLLFEKYIQLQKKDGHWSIVHRLPRYLRLDLWNMFFSSLLNQQSRPADSNVLQNILDESLKTRADDYYSDMRYLLNILRNR